MNLHQKPHNRKSSRNNNDGRRMMLLAAEAIDSSELLSEAQKVDFLVALIRSHHRKPNIKRRDA